MNKLKLVFYLLLCSAIVYAGNPSSKITTRRNQGELIRLAIRALEDSVTYKGKVDTSTVADAYTLTSATTTGPERALAINFTQTGASATKILEALRVNIDANVQTGDWVNAVVARVDYGVVGDASGGMVAPLCAELSLPARTPAGGAYYVADLEMEAPENHLNHGNASYPTAWLNFAIYGNGTAIASEEDNAYFIRTDGFTGAASNMISATAQTMRILAENSSGAAVTRYLVLSQTEDGLGLGTSGSPQSVTYNGTKPLSVYTTCASTDGGDSYEPVLINTVMTGAGQVGGRMRVNMETNVALGAWSNALKGQVTYGAAGKTTGIGSAICAEMTLSAGTNAGNYAPLELELNMGSAGVTGTRTGLMYMSVNDAAATTFDDLGYLFILNGLSAGTSGSDAFETSASVDANEITAGLRVCLDGVEYYLLMCTPTDIQD
jgi:hypothetical protein